MMADSNSRRADRVFVFPSHVCFRDDGLGNGFSQPLSIGQKPFLLLMGRKDEMSDPAKVQASCDHYIKGPITKLIWHDSGHKLPPEYVKDAVAWLKESAFDLVCLRAAGAPLHRRIVIRIRW